MKIVNKNNVYYGCCLTKQKAKIVFYLNNNKTKQTHSYTKNQLQLFKLPVLSDATAQGARREIHVNDI